MIKKQARKTTWGWVIGVWCLMLQKLNKKTKKQKNPTVLNYVADGTRGICVTEDFGLC